MMNIKDDIQNLFSKYLVDFHVVSDKAADTAKHGIQVLHNTACSLTPMIFSYRAIERFEKSRDKFIVSLHKHAYCTRCQGKGYLTVMSVGGEYVGNEPCPQCTLKGYHRMIGKEKDYKIQRSREECKELPPKEHKRETAIRVFDRMMDRAREEKSLPMIYCSQCKGQRMLHSRDKTGKYLGQKRCPHCTGTGKDYKAMALIVMEKCMKAHTEKGYSHDDAWNICMTTCFTE
jgi:DnaJ-class molecular chaperone